MKVSFITFGCKLNQAETEIFKNKLFNKGFEIVPENKQANLSAVASKAKADFFVINACAVTAKAEKEMRQKINQIRKQHPKSKIIVTGCYLPQKNEKVDCWIRRDKLIEYLSAQLIRNNNSKTTKQLPISQTRIFIKIQDGCDNYCSYCIVPFLRGRPVNRPLQKIISEIKKKESQGYKEIVLVGTDLRKVISLKFKVKSLTDLLKKILRETSIPRIRLSSLWPTALTPELIELVKKEVRICPHFHLSIQSGCDKILKKMNRHYTVSQIKKIINNALSIPNLNLTADFIVGFPGESDKDFLETYNFIKSIPFLKLHIFRYSPRPLTQAAKMPDQVASDIKRQRSQKLIILGEKISRQVRKKYLGKVLTVLFEKKDGSFWSGLTSNYLRVYVRSRKNLNNLILNVKLLRLYKNGIYGKIVNN